VRERERESEREWGWEIHGEAIEVTDTQSAIAHAAAVSSRETRNGRRLLYGNCHRNCEIV